MPKLDILHLEFVGRSYRCQMAVPRHLRRVIGKAKLVRSLKTDSLSTANMRKLKVLHDFRKEIADAERKLKGQGADPIMSEALEWRGEFAREAALGTADRTCLTTSPSGWNIVTRNWSRSRVRNGPRRWSGWPLVRRRRLQSWWTIG